MAGDCLGSERWVWVERLARWECDDLFVERTCEIGAGRSGRLRGEKMAR